MTPFEVYLVMQASLVGDVLLGFGSSIAVLAALLIVIGHIEEFEDTTIKLLWRTLKVSAFAFALGVLTPNTRTLAAMYVLPTVTSEKWQTEAADIYALAKSALREAVVGEEE